MGFPIKYETDEERLAAIRHSKNNYSNKPFTCSQCGVTILLGNKHKHGNTKKHRRNVKKMYQYAENRLNIGVNQV